jgi:hypothetical protein
MKLIQGTVEVTVKDGMTGTEKSEKGPVSDLELESVDDVLVYLSGNAVGTVSPAETDPKKLAERIAGFIKAVNYGLNLNARAAIRGELSNKLEGPDKAINKMVADMIKARASTGKPITEEQARKIAVTIMQSDPEAFAAMTD